MSELCKELEGAEGYLVEPEPEDIAKSEPEVVPCPTCGGPCTTKPARRYGPRRTQYNSLVKGKVVAEGWACVVGTADGKATEWWVYVGDRPLAAYPHSFPVLVIRKEDSNGSV